MATQIATKLFVGGQFRDARSGEALQATRPATGEELGPVAQGDRGTRASP
jgi:acyl-CoA reductase-like NAD-dependent aldehyde dehydrogenase